MRLFVAIEITPDIRDRILEFAEKLKSKIPNARWTRPEGLHITLKFLGNVPDENVPAIESALKKVDSRSFAITIERVGVFPNPKSPRVLWTGVAAGAELGKLAGEIDETTAQLGFEAEKRAFSPHVTLARFKEGDRKMNLSSILLGGHPSFGTMTAQEFHLYESKLSAEGSRYIKRAGFALK
jgi:2'-5' RNA ligase